MLKPHLENYKYLKRLRYFFTLLLENSKNLIDIQLHNFHNNIKCKSYSSPNVVYLANIVINYTYNVFSSQNFKFCPKHELSVYGGNKCKAQELNRLFNKRKQ